MTKTLSNDSTKQQMGFEYQKLIALEYCLNAKRGEYVYIECFGDVQSDDASIEVKHHGGESNLTSNSRDVWKTISNLVKEHDIIKSNNRFILHTTENVKEDSIFYGWNELKKNEKYKILKTHSISESSKKFKDLIFDTNRIIKSELLEILDKFIINYSQPKIKEKLKELMIHPSFDIIPENHTNDAIGVLIQWIIERAIENSNKWEVNITDFKNDLRSSLSKFTKDYIPFPIIEKATITNEEVNKGFKFINNLKAISLKERDLHQAFQDYIRSEDAYSILLKANPTLNKNLIAYENDIQDEITTEKSSISYQLTEESFSNNSHKEMSREVYFKCILKPHEEIFGIKGTQKYFRNGRIQNLNETTDFEWKYKETDL